MKTLRVTLLSLLAAGSVSAAFAGPGVQYWNTRRNPSSEKPTVTTPAKCDTMMVHSGRRDIMVECKGATAETPKCKAMCGS
jgi:hypothetical protein